MRTKLRCSRCGCYLTHAHYVDGLPVCTDDRLCYPGMFLTKRQKKLAELKRRYAGKG